MRESYHFFSFVLIFVLPTTGVLGSKRLVNEKFNPDYGVASNCLALVERVFVFQNMGIEFSTVDHENPIPTNDSAETKRLQLMIGNQVQSEVDSSMNDKSDNDFPASIIGEMPLEMGKKLFFSNGFAVEPLNEYWKRDPDGVIYQVVCAFEGEKDTVELSIISGKSNPVSFRNFTLNLKYHNIRKGLGDYRVQLFNRFEFVDVTSVIYPSLLVQASGFSGIKKVERADEIDSPVIFKTSLEGLTVVESGSGLDLGVKWDTELQGQRSMYRFLRFAFTERYPPLKTHHLLLLWVNGSIPPETSDTAYSRTTTHPRVYLLEPITDDIGLIALKLNLLFATLHQLNGDYWGASDDSLFLSTIVESVMRRQQVMGVMPDQWQMTNKQWLDSLRYGEATSKVDAARVLAESKVQQAIPYLIVALADTSALSPQLFHERQMNTTRYWVHKALVDLVGFDLGFRFNEPEYIRQQDVIQWKVWYIVRFL